MALNRPEKTNDTSAGREPSKTSQDVVADWLTVYGQVYRETLTEELVLAYELCLTDIDSKILHQAFITAMKSSKFRPTPAEVLEAVGAERKARAEREEFLGVPQLTYPEITPEERQAALSDPEYQERKEKALNAIINIAEQKKIPRPPRLVYATDERVMELSKQKDFILKAFPTKAS